MYGGPWSSRAGDRTLAVLLVGFLIVNALASCIAWLLWARTRRGALLTLGFMPVEAAFWFGFALPFAWLVGVIRAVLTLAAWRGRSTTAS
jgi:hypothetical protein